MISEPCLYFSNNFPLMWCQNKVGRLRGGIEFLELCGFERIEEDKYFFLPRDKVNLDVLNSAGLQIKSAMSNPFFAVLSHP